MKFVRDNLGPVLIVLLAAVMISLAAWPVGKTQWAEGIREQARAPDNVPGTADADSKPGGVALLVLPPLKVFVIMGIGVMFTAAGLWLVRKLKRKTHQERGDHDGQD